MSADERRISRDGGEYTLCDFLDWYGDEWGNQYWQEARVAGAPQPGGPGAPHPGGQDAPHPGAMAAGAPQGAAQAAATPAIQPTGTDGASQPGGPGTFHSGGQDASHPGVMAAGAPQAVAKAAAAPADQPTGTVGASQPGENPWEGSVFLTKTLRQNQETLRRECPHLHLATTPREAIDKAYSLAYYLPLPVQAFVNFDILPALGATGGAGQPAEKSVEAVVAERIPRVPDNNRPPSCRVDFFVYYRNGDVIRHHPGRTAQSSMHPHSMLSGSMLFSLAQAQEIGVGASLHLRPPGRAADAGAPQHGVVLCTRGDVDESCIYDVQMWTWRRVREILLQPQEKKTHVDVSDGHWFPWWLLLGGTGRQRPLLDRGVTHVVASGHTLVVTLLDGQVVLYSNRHERMELHEQNVA